MTYEYKKLRGDDEIRLISTDTICYIDWICPSVFEKWRNNDS